MWTSIRPTPPSVAIQSPGRPPPTFEILSDLPSPVAVEVATSAELFYQANLRNPASGPYNFFNSSQGDASLSIPAETVTAATARPTSYNLPDKIWRRISANSTRIYYRVVVPPNRGPTWFSTNKEASLAPYIHVLQPSDPNLVGCYRSRSVRRSLPWLMVQGNKLIEGRRTDSRAKPAAIAKPILLRGINLSGLQYREPGWPDQSGRRSNHWWQSADLTRDRISEIAQDWEANIIRLPVNQDWVLNGVAGKTGLDYLKDIDQLVDWIATANMYALIDLQLLYSPDYIGPMPDELSMVFWAILASRYRHDPAVLFDLTNEPHSPYQVSRGQTKYTPMTDPEPRYRYRGAVFRKPIEWVQLWHEWVRSLAGVIQRVHPDALLFVSGVGGPCWAASLRSMPIPKSRAADQRDAIPNAVYSSHIYRKDRNDPQDPFGSSNVNIGTLKESHWDYWFGFSRLRSEHPIFLGEWGGQDDDVDWGRALEGYLRTLHQTDPQTGVWGGLAGWTAWSWGDDPHLVIRDPTSNSIDRPYRTHKEPASMPGQLPKLTHIPTKFGELVKNALRSPP